jgi:hypothetical protein
MATSENTARDRYTATAGQTVFDFTFPVGDESDLTVIQLVALTSAEIVLSLGTDYTVSIGEDSTGNITLLVGAAINDTITIERDTTVERTTDFQVSGDYRAIEINAQLDAITRMIQDARRDASRSLVLKKSSSFTGLTVPDPEGGKALAWNSGGTALTNGPTSDEISNAQGYATAASASKVLAETAQGLAETAQAAAEAARDAIPAAADILVTGDIGVTVEAYDPGILKADTTNTLTVGFTETPLAYTSGDIAVSAGSLRTVDTAKNLIKSSEDFRTSSEGNPVSAWVASNCTVTIDAIAAPDGSLTADKLVEDSATTIKTRSQNVSVPDNSVVTFSIYAKAAENTQFELYGINSTNYVVARYNLSTVTSTLAYFSGTGVFLDSSIVDVGSGWYRCSLTYSLGTGITAYNNGVRFFDGTTTNYLGNGVNGFYVWGAQAEIGTLTDYQKAGATPETVLGMITGVGRVTLLLTGGGTVAYDAGYDKVVGMYDSTKSGCVISLVNDGTNQWIIFANTEV